jgi:hypothetical protein
MIRKNEDKSIETLGFRPSCSHPEAAQPVPSVVLDPFVGSGTVVAEAVNYGARAIGIDLSLKYLEEIAEGRVERDVLGVSREEQSEGQLLLWGAKEAI